MGQSDNRVDYLPEAYESVDRRVFGMPGPVWTMALWFGSSALVLAFALLQPMNPAARGPIRFGVLAYCVCICAALLVMRARTPGWFLYVQTAVSVIAALWIVYIAITPSGAVTSSISLIIVAAYIGWWMDRIVALAYMLYACLGLLLVYAWADRLPTLLTPWLVVSGTSIGLLLAFGTLIAHMKEQLVTDPLTGLLNRSGMVLLVDHRGDAARTVTPRALMVIDLDQFKVINDRDGHLAGDRTLVNFGAALRSIIRPEDIAFRSGGDEFVLILPRTDTIGAEAVADRLRSAIDVQWSYGLTEWELGEDFDAAVARADSLMYEQKAERARRRESA